MPTVREKFRGVRFDDGGATVQYLIFSASNADNAYDALEVAAPQFFRDMELENISIDDQINNTTFVGTAHYSFRQAQDPTYIQYSFEIGTGSQHITQSLKTVKKYPTEAPDTKGVIGVDAKGKVKGADILVPEGTWSETQYFGEEEITSTYKRLLRTMCGKVNIAPFKGDQAGECLFLGCSGTRITIARNNPGPRGDRWTEFFWEMQFRFASSENHSQANGNKIKVKIKDQDVEIEKEGWQYLWFLYETTKVEASGDLPARMLQQPVAAYVEDVYEKKDFAALDIGIL